MDADHSSGQHSTRMLSLAAGLISVGMAVGPTFGGLLIRATHQVLTVFYAALILYLFCIVSGWAVLPESLSRQQTLASKERYAAAQQLAGSGWGRLFRLHASLSIFLPARAKSAPGSSDEQKMDWNLTLVAVAYASTVTALVDSMLVHPGHRKADRFCL
jgi:MFS family permease